MSGVTAGGVVTAGVLCAVEGCGELGDEKQRGWPRRRRQPWCWGGEVCLGDEDGGPYTAVRAASREDRILVESAIVRA